MFTGTFQKALSVQKKILRNSCSKSANHFLYLHQTTSVNRTYCRILLLLLVLYVIGIY